MSFMCVITKNFNVTMEFSGKHQKCSSPIYRVSQYKVHTEQTTVTSLSETVGKPRCSRYAQTIPDLLIN